MPARSWEAAHSTCVSFVYQVLPVVSVPSQRGFSHNWNLLYLDCLQFFKGSALPSTYEVPYSNPPVQCQQEKISPSVQQMRPHLHSWELKVLEEPEVFSLLKRVPMNPRTCSTLQTPSCCVTAIELLPRFSWRTCSRYLKRFSTALKALFLHWKIKKLIQEF